MASSRFTISPMAIQRYVHSCGVWGTHFKSATTNQGQVLCCALSAKLASCLSLVWTCCHCCPHAKLALRFSLMQTCCHCCPRLFVVTYPGMDSTRCQQPGRFLSCESFPAKPGSQSVCQSFSLVIMLAGAPISKIQCPCMSACVHISPQSFHWLDAPDDLQVEVQLKSCIVLVTQ